MHGNGIFGVVEGRWLVVHCRRNNRGSAKPLGAMHGDVVHGVVRRRGLVACLRGSSRGSFEPLNAIHGNVVHGVLRRQGLVACRRGCTRCLSVSTFLCGGTGPLICHELNEIRQA